MKAPTPVTRIVHRFLELVRRGVHHRNASGVVTTVVTLVVGAKWCLIAGHVLTIARVLLPEREQLPPSRSGLAPKVRDAATTRISVR